MKHIEKYIDCLNSDFIQIKQEIARRSNLQKAVLTGYIGLIAFITNRILDEKQDFILIIGLLISLFLVQVYNYREWLEIRRLGKIISTKIAPSLTKVMELKETIQIYQSQTDPEIENFLSHKYRRKLSKIFNWIFFALIPILIILYFLFSKEIHISVFKLSIVILLLCSNLFFTYYTEHMRNI